MIRSLARSRRHLQAVPPKKLVLPISVRPEPDDQEQRDFQARVDALAAQCGVHPRVILAQIIEQSPHPLEWKIAKLQALGVPPSEVMKKQIQAMSLFQLLASLGTAVTEKVACGRQVFSGMADDVQ